MASMFKGRRAESNNGWTGYGPWPYTVLEEPDLTNHIERLAAARTEGTTQSLSFQPFPSPNKNQDRYTVTQWDTPQGAWKVFAVFDGHAGHDTAEHANRHLIPALQAAIASAQSSVPGDGPLSSSQVIDLLKTSVSAFDGEIASQLLELFPGGVEAIANMSDDEIRAIVLADGHLHPAIPLCLAGTTVLVALLDPARQLYVVSLGDSIAVLGLRTPQGVWEASVLSAFHNGLDKSEAERLHGEHPNEPGCLSNGRVLGGIAVTRALGDHVFKLPSLYTERVFKIAYPDAHIVIKAEGFLPRCLTPPYLSNVPHVAHVDLGTVATEDAVLVIASDGLTDLKDEHHQVPLALAERWVQVAAASDKPALGILRDAMGGEDVEKVSFWVTVEMEDPWMDDTTVVVTRF
ncbi:protein serine/threonine phosphatase 2C [Trametopsis cervina]|nr:protein serine/threonine phosphatase 2C [Trametopsis cervina]